MKKWLWFLAAFLVVAMVGTKPSAGKDVAELQPVQVVCLGKSGDNIAVWTDTGDWGMGLTLDAAVEDMKMAAAGEVFLETADYLLLMEDCLLLLEDVAAYLRPSCSLCFMQGEPDLNRIGQFLRTHVPEITLIEYNAGIRKLQTLKTEKGRMYLVS